MLPRRVRADSSTGRHLGSFIDESVAGSTAIQHASSMANLNGKPLIVVTAGTGHDAQWQPAQEHKARPRCRPTLSTVSPTPTSHESLIDDEADSAAAIQAIHDVVASSHLPRRRRTEAMSTCACACLALDSRSA
jgi:hypothetical protein